MHLKALARQSERWQASSSPSETLIFCGAVCFYESLFSNAVVLQTISATCELCDKRFLSINMSDSLSTTWFCVWSHCSDASL